MLQTKLNSPDGLSQYAFYSGLDSASTTVRISDSLTVNLTQEPCNSQFGFELANMSNQMQPVFAFDFYLLDIFANGGLVNVSPVNRANWPLYTIDSLKSVAWPNNSTGPGRDSCFDVFCQTGRSSDGGNLFSACVFPEFAMVVR
ncbi:unnamed protein product [Protopolystoma xenopodis]|uniref:Uncharacterized protein n=1 Tax=Protopolystoma xenopodis TaxID=117903 RepID=A0A3S5ARG9_9PLAT|nr:unnamed protein product [Protopolystoma xenopodis]